MAKLLGFTLSETATPVEYIETGGGDFGAPGTGGWQAVGEAFPVETIPLGAEEQVKAGIDTPTDARNLYFKLDADGSAPFNERTTLDIGGVRFNVRIIVVYNKAGFPKGGEAQVVKL